MVIIDARKTGLIGKSWLTRLEIFEVVKESRVKGTSVGFWVKSYSHRVLLGDKGHSQYIKTSGQIAGWGRSWLIVCEFPVGWCPSGLREEGWVHKVVSSRHDVGASAIFNIICWEEVDICNSGISTPTIIGDWPQRKAQLLFWLNVYQFSHLISENLCTFVYGGYDGCCVFWPSRRGQERCHL